MIATQSKFRVFAQLECLNNKTTGFEPACQDVHSIQGRKKRFFSKLYDSGNRLLGKIDKSLRKGSKIKDDHYEKDSEKVCGKPQTDSRHLGFYAGIRRSDHL